MTYVGISYDLSTIMTQQDTRENSALTMLFDNTTGGQDCAHMSKTMFKDVASANNSKSTGHLPNQPSSQLKGRNHFDLLQIALWISLQTCHRRTDTILSWSW